MKQKRKWTKDEVDILLKNPTMLVDKLRTLLPQRSIISIKRKKVRLGIKRWPKFSKWEKEFLIKNYYSAPQIVLVKALKRKWSTIQSRAHALGLKRSKEFTIASIKERWKDEKFTESMKAQMSRINNDPKIRWEITRKLKAWTSMNINKLKDQMINMNNDPEFQEKRLKAIEKLWQDGDFRKRFFQAGSMTGYYGSQGQKYAYNYLRSMLKNIEVFNNDWSILKTQQLDITIPKYKIAIEYNGPFHYYPIRGKKRLAETIRKDIEKRDKLKSMGWKLFVIKADRKNLTKIDIEGQCEEIIKNIPDYHSFNPKQKQLVLR